MGQAFDAASDYSCWTPGSGRATPAAEAPVRSQAPKSPAAAAASGSSRRAPLSTGPCTSSRSASERLGKWSRQNLWKRGPECLFGQPGYRQMASSALTGATRRARLATVGRDVATFAGLAAGSRWASAPHHAIQNLRDTRLNPSIDPRLQFGGEVLNERRESLGCLRHGSRLSGRTFLGKKI